MTDDLATQWIALGREYEKTARGCLEARPARLAAGFANARHAAELGGKALLIKSGRPAPRRHEIGAILFKAGVLPSSLDPRQTDRLLRQHTRGEYGVAETPTGDEVRTMMSLARSLLEAAADWPRGTYHGTES